MGHEQVHKKGLLYKGYKSMPYCPRCATPLSNFELNEGYNDDVTDPSVYVKFKLVDEDAYLLGWTTTPWSLPGNAAIAVKPERTYVYVKTEQGVLVLAKNRVEAVMKVSASLKYSSNFRRKTWWEKLYAAITLEKLKTWKL